MFCVSTLCFVGVLHMMGLMVFSAVKEHTSATSRRSLLFIYMCTLLIWSMFPLAWVLHAFNSTSPYGEYMNVFANFMAKVCEGQGWAGNDRARGSLGRGWQCGRVGGRGLQRFGARGVGASAGGRDLG
jgi:hypothetical protein